MSESTFSLLRSLLGDFDFEGLQMAQWVRAPRSQWRETGEAVAVWTFRMAVHLGSDLAAAALCTRVRVLLHRNDDDRSMMPAADGSLLLRPVHCCRRLRGAQVRDVVVYLVNVLVQAVVCATTS